MDERKSTEILAQIVETFMQFVVQAYAYRDENNKAASRRARKVSSELNKILKEYRKVTVEENTN